MSILALREHLNASLTQNNPKNAQVQIFDMLHMKRVDIQEYNGHSRKPVRYACHNVEIIKKNKYMEITPN